jgi:prepilin-type processing-associated H-X9-DG protein
LIELIVVLAIIAILIGFLLAAVQRIRENAIKTRCSNNLRQAALGVLMFHDSNGFFPNAGGTIQGVPSFPVISTTTSNGTKTWGVGDPRASPRFQPGPWAFAILPYVEQGGAFRDRIFGVSVPSYMCPGRGRLNPQVVPDTDPIFKNCTYSAGQVRSWGKTDYAANLQISLGNYQSTVQTGNVRVIGEITDGTTSTLMLGEKSMDRRAYDTGGWFWDEPIFAGGAAGGTVRSGNTVQLDGNGTDFQDNWGSSHPSGTGFAFVDGSVRTIRFAINRSIMKALLSPAGSEVIDDSEIK